MSLRHQTYKKMIARDVISCFLFTITTVVAVGGVYLYVDVDDDDDDGEVNGVIMRRRTASHPKTLQGKEKKTNSEM